MRGERKPVTSAALWPIWSPSPLWALSLGCGHRETRQAKRRGKGVQLPPRKVLCHACRGVGA